MRLEGYLCSSLVKNPRKQAVFYSSMLLIDDFSVSFRLWLYLCNGSEVHSDASSELSFDLHFEARLHDVTL